MITCEQSFHNVFFSLHRTPEVHGCRAGPTELQNYNFTGFSVVKFQISWKSQRKDHWRQCPLKSWLFPASMRVARLFLVLPGWVSFCCSILGTCGWGGGEVCIWASAPPAKMELGDISYHHNDHLGAGCHSATKTSIILSVRIVENFFWVMHAWSTDKDLGDDDAEDWYDDNDDSFKDNDDNVSNLNELILCDLSILVFVHLLEGFGIWCQWWSLWSGLYDKSLLDQRRFCAPQKVIIWINKLASLEATLVRNYDPLN